MNLSEARAAVAQLKAGDTFTLGGEPFEVTSRDCGVVEFVRPQHREITGAFHRASVENLALKMSAAS